MSNGGYLRYVEFGTHHRRVPPYLRPALQAYSLPGRSPLDGAADSVLATLWVMARATRQLNDELARLIEP